jgi:type I restriction enzyme M protein
MPLTLAELLKDSAYRLGQFKPAQIAALEAAITLEESAKKPAPYLRLRPSAQ